MPEHYHIWTIGCQMNKAESERLSSYLNHLGWKEVSKPEEADLIILNSCVVRQSAENRVVNKLHNLKRIKKINPNAIIALTGCLVGSDFERVKKAYPFVDYFFSPGDFPAWLGEYDSYHILPLRPSVASYIPIMQGCNNFCSYCIVPYRRGREKSRTIQDVYSEIETMVKRGVKEVTLLGQNVDSYGHDLPERPDLADLLTTVNNINGLDRIRFLTNHPKDMKSKLIEAVAALPKVCEQLNLPAQAGDNEILKAMNRGYTAEEYSVLIDEIRSKVPNIALSTDIIVGFPGETEDQFENTYKLLENIKFDMVHVAAYSVRTGTYAAKNMIDNVLPEEKKRRLEKIEKLQAKLSEDINSTLINQVLEVLVEGKEKGKWFGRTRTDKLVFFKSEGDYQSQLVKLKINRSSPWSLSGEII